MVADLILCKICSQLVCKQDRGYAAFYYLKIYISKRNSFCYDTFEKIPPPQACAHESPHLLYFKIFHCLLSW